MNKSLRVLLVLAIGALGSMQAEHNLFIKIPTGLKYDFITDVTLKNGEKISVNLDAEGNTDIFIANLNDIDYTQKTFSFYTKSMIKSYVYHGILGVLKTAISEMGANPKKDYLITIETVGGFTPGSKWKSKNEWIAENTALKPVPVKLINASDWNLEIKYTEEPAFAVRKITKYLIKHDQLKVNFLELSDAGTLEVMNLQGKHAAPGTWTGWATSLAALNSTSEDISSKIRTAKSKITDPSTETIAIIVKHVQRFTGTGLAGKAWDVEVIVVKQSDNIEDIAKGYSVTKTPDAPVATPVAGKPARAGFAPKLTAPAKTGYQVAIQNNSGHTVKILEQHGDQMNPQVEVAKATNALVEDVDSLSRLSFAVDGFGAYDAMPMVKEAQAKKLLKGFQKQYLIFDIRHVGKTQDTWVVKVKVRSYNTDGTKKGDEPLTYKHGGRIKKK